MPRPGSPRHLAPVFGASLAALDVDRDATLRLHLHGVARGLVSAAVRLGLVGPNEAQRTAGTGRARRSTRCSRTVRDLEVPAQTQTAPLHDLLAGGHERLYSRLFSS